MYTGQHEHPTLTTAFKNVYGCMDTSWERDKGNPILTAMVIPQERAATRDKLVTCTYTYESMIMIDSQNYATWPSGCFQ